MVRAASLATTAREEVMFFIVSILPIGGAEHCAGSKKWKHGPQTRRFVGVTAVIDPKTGKPVPLGNGAPALTGQKTKIPDTVWSDLKAFKPASYFAVSI